MIRVARLSAFTDLHIHPRQTTLQMIPLSRRQFIRKSALASAATLVSAKSYSQIIGSNGDLRIAVVGLNGRGRNHLAGFRKLPGVRVVALCDVDTAVLEREYSKARADGLRAETYVDFRELITRDDIDAVSIATPNHQHALQAIWACQAGKDVYLEKPVSHNIWEGRQIVAAAAQTGRIVAAGTQCRSSYSIAEAVAWVQAGHIGEIKAARGLCYKPRRSIGKIDEPAYAPKSVDYNLWLGPAKTELVGRSRFHYDWHWQWSYGNGDLGNQGIHQMDIARWFLGENGLAPKVQSFGGRLGYIDDGQTPNTMVTVHSYEKAPLIFEVRGLPTTKDSDQMDSYHGASIGVIIHCEGGFVVVPSYSKAIAYSSDGSLLRVWEGADNHYANFAESIRAGNASNLNASILDGHISSALCHAGNVSIQLGQNIATNAPSSNIKKNVFATEAFERVKTHLNRNEIDFAQTPLTSGPTLNFDAKTERFKGANAKAANALLSRDYRTGFVVPELA